MGKKSSKTKYINPFSEKAASFARKIDDATQKSGLEELKSLADEALKCAEISDVASQAFLFYCVATATGEFSKLEGSSSEEKALEKQIYYFRKSIALYEREELQKKEYLPYVVANICTAYANYANALRNSGRIVAAIAEYNRVISINPKFGMAWGLLGKAYQHYARLVSDNGHQHCLHHCAFQCLKKAAASDDPNVFPEARDSFRDALAIYTDAHIEAFEKMDFTKNDYEYPSQEELDYRNWCLSYGLFINPLNDLPYRELAFAADTLKLPGITIKDSQSWDNPVFHKMFNQLKQEYVYSRWLLYCSGQERDDVHFADRDTCITNTLDYTQHSIRHEQMKSSFKTAYSIFDKIAFFLNVYFNLGIKERDISYTQLWQNQNLLSKENYALDALRWIYKDFRKKISDATQPKAERLYKIRNSLEHRFIRIFWDFVSVKSEDDFESEISESELIEETMVLLKIAREALIYLCFAVHIEEFNMNRDKDNKPTAPIILDDYDDNWKI